ncbi:hypothetical protein [Saccharomonospora saliphila]|uniref:hypothetical protein n=1 Tax=Saccharomonospora saliphila TaxID=369829 RepID=UPI0012FC2B97
MRGVSLGDRVEFGLSKVEENEVNAYSRTVGRGAHSTVRIISLDDESFSAVCAISESEKCD